MKLFERRCQFCSADYEYEIPDMDYYDTKFDAMRDMVKAVGTELSAAAVKNFWSEQAKILLLRQGLCPYHAEAASYLVYYDVADRTVMEQARKAVLHDLESVENA